MANILKPKTKLEPISASARAKKKNRALLIFCSLVFLGIILGAIAMCVFVFFKVSTINVAGAKLYTPQEIVLACGIKPDDNLVFTDVAAVEEKIFKDFPYVEKVKVKKVIPSTIEIEVVEAEVYYSIESDSKYVYVSSRGKILEIGTEPKEDSILIKVDSVSDQEGYVHIEKDEGQNIFNEILAVFSDREKANITEINITNLHKITVIYDNRVTLELGSAVELTYKINFGLQIIDAGGISDTERGTLNLSLAKENNKAYFSAEIASSSAKSDDKSTASDDGNSDEGNSDSSSAESTESADDTASSKESTRGQDIPDVP